jgi:hypothetical protein
MPNWCANSLKLVAKTTDSEKKLAEIVQELARAKAAGDDAAIFNLVKPIPKSLHITAGFLGLGTPEQSALLEAEKKNQDTYGYKNWYEFCTGEWGTKWEARTQEDLFIIDGNQVTIFFDTAWSPPMGIYHALEDMGFHVEATYVEQGMGYIGYYTNGMDTCEQMAQFYSQDNTSEENEEDFPVVCEKVDKFFKRSGFNHMPSNLGG